MQGRRFQEIGGVFSAIRRGSLGAENDADAGRSFAAVEWHYSDRLLARIGYKETIRGNPAESSLDSPVRFFADERGGPLERGLSRAVEPPHGKEEAQGKVSVVLGVAGGIRTRRHG